MEWEIKFSSAVKKELKKIAHQHVQRILQFLFDRVAKLNDPRQIGETLHGPKLNEYWKYRVGDYRIISKINDDEICILVVKIGHRKEVYRHK